MPATAHVVRVTKTWDGLLAGKDRAVAIYQVLFDEPQYASEIVAKTASDGTTTIPAIGAAHSGDAALYVASVTAETQGGPALFQIVVEYGRSSASSPVDREPTTTAWTWWIGTACYTQPIDEDQSGNDIVNSAGDPYDPPIEEEFYDTLYRGQKLIADAAWASIDPVDYVGHLNDGTVTIDGKSYLTERCRMNSLTVDAVSVDGVNYRRVTAEIQVRKISPYWKRRILDCGYNYLDGSVKKRAVDETGAAFGGPQNLDGSGGLGGPHWDEYKTKPKVAWTAFSLT